MKSPLLKTTYAARAVSKFQIDASRNLTHSPMLGDLACFEVLSIGKHSRMQMADKTLQHIYPGDQLMAVVGPRYATAQFEGYVPPKPTEEFHILGQGGAVGYLESAHSKFAGLGPTCLRLIGYAHDEQERVINTRYYGQTPREFKRDHLLSPFQTILSVGSSMDSGKTTTAAYLAKGLRAAGKRVAYIKLTGTIYSKDADLNAGLGAEMAIDFSHFGYPSTYTLDLPELLQLHESLLSVVGSIQPDYVVIEIADGILQRETAGLLLSSEFMNTIDHVLFSCGDSLAALGGLQRLRQMHIEPLAICGAVTASPLMIQEIQSFTSLPILNLSALANPEVLNRFTPVQATPVLQSFLKSA